MPAAKASFKLKYEFNVHKYTEREEEEDDDLNNRFLCLISLYV